MTSSPTVPSGGRHGITNSDYHAGLYKNDKHADTITEMEEGSSPIDDTPRDTSSSLFTDSSSEASDSDIDVDQGVSP